MFRLTLPLLLKRGVVLNEAGYNQTMCGRYTVSATPNELKNTFHVEGQMPVFKTNYNVAPGQQIPVISRNSPNKLSLMQWGFVPEWAKPHQVKFRPINARADKLSGRYYKKSFMEKRCIIPSNGFYEWHRVNLEGKEEKIPYFIHLKDRDLFGFAGIYSEHKDADAKAHSFAAIITTEANPFMKKIHSRMPVIIQPSDLENWLSSETKMSDIMPILRKTNEYEMEAWQVDRKVGNAKNNDPSLTARLSKIHNNA